MVRKKYDVFIMITQMTKRTDQVICTNNTGLTSPPPRPSMHFHNFLFKHGNWEVKTSRKEKKRSYGLVQKIMSREGGRGKDMVKLARKSTKKNLKDDVFVTNLMLNVTFLP